MVSRRSGVAVAGAAVLILVIAAGFLYLRGGSTAVSVDSAVRQFRTQPHLTTLAPSGTAAVKPAGAPRSVETTRSAQAPASRTAAVRAAAGRPPVPEGVYVYATTGEDDVDVLGGSTHVYPDQTTITVRHAGCGLIEHWDVLKERWDERESCRSAAGDVLHRLSSYHEFFRHGDLKTFGCTGFTYPAGEAPGTEWTVRCDGSGTTTVTTLRAVAWEYVTVGSARVRTLHVHASSTIGGDQHGTSERDVWGSSVNGLVLRERARVDSESTQPVFGKTHYHEQYEIRLTSLTPQR